MIKNIESILLFAQNAEKLAGFYKAKLGLKTSLEAVIGEDDEEVYVFSFNGGTTLSILDHSDVKGRNKTPQRIMFNLEVDDIKKEVKLLDSKGVNKIQDTYHMENYGYIATFEDIEGNYFQLVQTKES